MAFPHDSNPTALGFDARLPLATWPDPQWVSRRKPLRWARRKIGTWRGLPIIESYESFAERQMSTVTADDAWYPCLAHAWDNTPRTGRNGVVFVGATPELFRKVISTAIDALGDRPLDRRLLFLKSWNEWAEGNHLEPDLRFGTGFLQA